MIRYLLAAGIGATLAYFLDPDRGRRRRNMARDRMMATMRRTGERMEREARYAASTAQGLQRKAEHLSQQQVAPLDLNDADLAHKVETELFRDPHVPKGDININAENGVVVLRGEVRHPDEINNIERKVREIPGVAGVENLLHLPHTSAPMS